MTRADAAERRATGTGLAALAMSVRLPPAEAVEEVHVAFREVFPHAEPRTVRADRAGERWHVEIRGIQDR